MNARRTMHSWLKAESEKIVGVSGDQPLQAVPHLRSLLPGWAGWLAWLRLAGLAALAGWAGWAGRADDQPTAQQADDKRRLTSLVLGLSLPCRRAVSHRLSFSTAFIKRNYFSGTRVPRYRAHRGRPTAVPLVYTDRSEGYVLIGVRRICR